MAQIKQLQINVILVIESKFNVGNYRLKPQKDLFIGYLFV